MWAALQDSKVAIPEATATAMRTEVTRIALENLMLAAEARRLAAAFQRAGVPLLFVKGLTLAKLSYGSISLKKGWDTDLLITRDKLSEAASLLVELGYEASLPQEVSVASLQAWHARSKESVWRHPARGHFVELHTSLVNSPYLLPGVGLESEAVDVEVVEGVVLPTLARDELFAYLCVHGASSAWFRLKWLADLAAFAGGDAAENERLFRRAQELGSGRSAAQALLLAADLLDMPIPPALQRELWETGANRMLTVAAKRLIIGRKPALELHERRFGTWAIHWTQLFLLPAPRYKMLELKRQLAETIYKFLF